MARLFVDPRQIERMIAASPPRSKASDLRIIEMLGRYLAAVEYAGATLEWNDEGIVLHAIETLDRRKLEPWLLRWATNDLRPDPTIAGVPATAIALASGHVDAVALYDALCRIVPDQDQPKLRNMETLLGGLMLGQDLRTRILPQLGPGVDRLRRVGAGGFRRSRAKSRPATLLPRRLLRCLSWASGKTASREQRTHQTPAASRPQAQSRTPCAACLPSRRLMKSGTTADHGSQPTRSPARTSRPSIFPFHLHTRSTPPALDRAGHVCVGRRALPGSRSAPDSGERFRQLRARAFPDAQTFLCVDLTAMHNLAGRRHDRLVEILATRQNRPAAEVDRDLSQLLAFARLFDAAYFTSRFEPEAAAVHQRIGLLLPDSMPAKTAQP